MTGAMRLLSLSRPVALVLVMAIYLANTDRVLPFMALLTISAGFFIASSAVVVGWIPAPRRWAWMAIWLEIALAALLNWQAGALGIDGPMPIIFFPPAISVFLVMERRHWAGTITLLVLGWVASSVPDWYRLGPQSALSFVGVYGILLVFAVSTGLLIRSLGEAQQQAQTLLSQVREAQAAQERTLRQLRESVAREQEAAVLGERQRLAREIHDGVAHALTALIVQIQAGRRLVERAPAEAVGILVRCEDTARAALQETRQAVRALHPSGLEGHSEVEALCKLGRDFGAATGMAVTVTADASAQDLPPDLPRLEQLYRIFQEALTNAHRHGHARQVVAHFHCGAHDLQFTVWNDGEPPQSLTPGLGLKAMAERAHALGGELVLAPGAPARAGEVAAPAGRGLTLRVTVPLRQEAVT